MKHVFVLIGITAGLLLLSSAQAAQLDASKFNETEVQ